MENMTTKITSSYNNALDIKVVDGHFATNHSHKLPTSFLLCSYYNIIYFTRS